MFELGLLIFKLIFQDEDLYYDLLDLEKRVNENWLTTPEQKEKWEKSSDL